MPLPTGLGESGEICVTGPQVMAGFWNRPEETLDALRGGRLRTGDIGYLDPNGYLYIIDRIKDLIITGGFNVYPRVVEEAIYQHPAVAEVAVCGVPDRHRGEVVKAFVKLAEDVTLTGTELRGFLKDKLATSSRCLDSGASHRGRGEGRDRGSRERPAVPNRSWPARSGRSDILWAP